WALELVSQQVSREIQEFKKFEKAKCKCLLCTYLKTELSTSKTTEMHRIVYENENFVVLVPFWAVWPFETMILPKHHMSSLFDLVSTNQNQKSLVAGQTYDTIDDFLNKQPNTLVADFANSLKFFVGYEMMAEAQRDLTPEQAAQRLRDL
ncbi:hypothetical protein BB558_004825, partial [Smittium angustum]